MTRKEAIQILADLIDSPFLHTWEKQNKALHMAIEALSAEAETKTGEWVKIIDEETPNLTKWHYECDQCGAGRWEEGQRYCQNCGARMIREDGEA